MFTASEEMGQSCENRWRVIEGRGEAILRAQWDEIMPKRGGEQTNFDSYPESYFQEVSE